MSIESAKAPTLQGPRHLPSPRCRGHRQAIPHAAALADGGTGGGHIEVCYAAQWPTFLKAQRLGYIDDGGDLTEAETAYLDLHQL